MVKGISLGLLVSQAKLPQGGALLMIVKCSRLLVNPSQLF